MSEDVEQRMRERAREKAANLAEWKRLQAMAGVEPGFEGTPGAWARAPETRERLEREKGNAP